MMAQLNLHHGTGTSSEGVVRVAVRCEYCQIIIQQQHHDLTNEAVKFRVGTLNVGTMQERSGEEVHTLTRKCIDLCCIARWTRGEMDWCVNENGYR